uniref:Uncharacterized protein n=1 Tax=Anguilla anguilla TaxID=7936 RepID=A0A0E9W8F7_ANGAN
MQDAVKRLTERAPVFWRQEAYGAGVAINSLNRFLCPLFERCKSSD